MAKIGAIILAAGLSSRMGRFKLLLPLSDGKPILQHVVATLTPVNVMPIMVVTGNRADDVQTALAGKPVQFAYNPHYAQGELLSSLQVGLRHMPTDVDAALVMLGDMPFISVATIRQIIHNYAPSSIVVPFYDG